MTTEKIFDILRVAEGISDFRIYTTRTLSNEVFFVKGKVETVRSTDTTSTQVTVFVRSGDVLGDASFFVYSADGEDDVKAKMEGATRSAGLIRNKAYDLPSDEMATYDNGAFDDPMQVAEDIAKEIFSLDLSDGLSLNALEVFLYTDTIRVVNSRGVSKTERRRRAMVEAIPTFTENGESVELYECYTFSTFSRDALREEMAKKLAEVRDRFHAKAPVEKLCVDVVLPSGELSELFFEIADQFAYGTIYNKQNAFSIGAPVVKDGTGDPLTVTLCGSLPTSARSRAFDVDGVTMRETTVIENSMGKEGFGGVRYASYLGKEPTGDLPCMKVNVGTLTEAELATRPYLKVASMSGLQLDIYNDYIGGEVRLAYLVDGERVTPITGISLSGKLSDALSSMRLSDTVYAEGSYEGPALARFSGIDIV
ncbi:MAG: hypothetical protein IKC72_04605 [Clostridia bacterium]|nr:hypothetical protein [Clostridia bacterium]